MGNLREPIVNPYILAAQRNTLDSNNPTNRRVLFTDLLLQFSQPFGIYPEAFGSNTEVLAVLSDVPITEQLAYDAVGLILPDQHVQTTPTNWGQEIL